MILTEEQMRVRDAARPMDPRVLSIHEGTSEIRRLLIGRALAAGKS